ncbi:MAG: hypothetical protein QOI74_2436 [Micromonosporaceae bacterium]|jgi:hypothetical protein|nr:hypothetical protein [Micromonosporaceae bacterium]
MNTAAFDGRRADRFAQLLDEAGGARRRHVRSRSDLELAGLVAVGSRLAGIDVGVRADPEFRDGLRAMLMATIERDGIGVTAVDDSETVVMHTTRHPSAGAARTASWAKTRRTPLRSRRARGAVVIGLAVGTLTVSGMSAASGDAVPGDALYGMKRSTERAQLALASSQTGRGELYLDFAKTRMNEAAAIRNGAPSLSGVLDDMDGETRQGVRLLATAAVDRRDPTALDVIEAFAGGQRRTLHDMLATLTGDARIRTLSSLALLDQISHRVSGLHAALRCPTATTVRADDLGPTPHPCASN